MEIILGTCVGYCVTICRKRVYAHVVLTTRGLSALKFPDPDEKISNSA